MHHLTEDRAFLERLQNLSGNRAGSWSLEAISGGCIHRAFRLQNGATSYFLKCNEAGQADNFAAEADGLAALRKGAVLRVPEPLDHGVNADMAWLLMEWIDISPLGHASAARLGEGLAELHSPSRDTYGWPRDNFIGASRQLNTPDQDWCRFFARQRLAPQLEWAVSAGLLSQADLHAATPLLQGLEAFFPDGAPPPTLLHGDLWGGNAAQDANGNPVVFDPAVYCGDPEADLAMMELFGGFPASFWSAYHACLPRRPGHEARRVLYQLYHVLNHANLFGGGYVNQARRMMNQLVEQL